MMRFTEGNMANELDIYIDELQHTVILAELNYDVWWVYEGKETREQFLGAMNDYVSFFTISIHAHFVAMLTALYRLYETRQDTKNIPQLLRLIEAEGSVDKTVLKELEERCSSEAKSLWLKVSDLRNKAFSHRSKSLSVEEVFQKAAIKPNDLVRLIEVSKELLNKITEKRSRSTNAFNLTSRGDVIGILEVLTDIWKRRQQEIERLSAPA